MNSHTLMTLSKLDVLHLLMWWTKSTSSGGKKTGHVWLCIFYVGILVLQILLHTLVDILEKYLNLKSQREIVNNALSW